MAANPARTVRPVNRAARWCRRAAVAAGTGAALVAATPGLAHAATAGWNGTLYPAAPRQCVGATARATARVAGTATGSGGHFVVLRDGVQFADTSLTTSAYAATLSGPGFYQLCVRDPQTATTPIYASISVRTDGS
jgi:hypothetical protein